MTGKMCKAAIRLIPFRRNKILLERFASAIFFQNGIRLRERLTNVQLRLRLSDEITRNILLEGTYEPQSLHLAMEIMRNGGWFVDVGASFGLFSCLLSSLPSVKTLSIEPYYEAFGQLCHNLEYNKLNNVVAFNGCASNASSVAKFCCPSPGNIGLGKMLPGEEGSFDYLTGACSLAKIFQEVGVSSVQLLKIDVEGAEMNVLKSLDLSGENRPMHIITEYQSIINPEVASLFNFLQQNGYQAFMVDGSPLAAPPTITPTECNLWFKSSYD